MNPRRILDMRPITERVIDGNKVKLTKEEKYFNDNLSEKKASIKTAMKSFYLACKDFIAHVDAKSIRQSEDVSYSSSYFQNRCFLQSEFDWYLVRSKDKEFQMNYISDIVERASAWTPLTLPLFELSLAEQEKVSLETQRRIHAVRALSQSLLVNDRHGTAADIEIMARPNLPKSSLAKTKRGRRKGK